jgi:hypothetical protein
MSLCGALPMMSFSKYASPLLEFAHGFKFNTGKAFMGIANNLLKTKPIVQTVACRRVLIFSSGGVALLALLTSLLRNLIAARLDVLLDITANRRATHAEKTAHSKRFDVAS